MKLLLNIQFLLLLLACARVTHQYSEIGWKSDPSWRGERIQGIDNCVLISRSSQSLDHGHVHDGDHVDDGHHHAFDDDHSHDHEHDDDHSHDDEHDDDPSHDDEHGDDHSHDHEHDDDHSHDHEHDDHGDEDGHGDEHGHGHGDHEEEDWTLFPGIQKISISHYPVLVCDGGRYDNLNFSLVPDSIGDIIIRWDKTETFPISAMTRFKYVTCLHFLGDGTTSFINANMDSDPTNINEFVTSLRMPEGSLTTVPKTFLKKFKVINELSLERNYLSRIENDDFSEIDTLEALFLGHNRLTRLNMGWLMSTTKLKLLDVRATTIDNVPMELSRIENALEYIDMSDNFISSIDASAFNACPNLRMVMLSNNRITRLDTNAFVGASKLQYIDLSANQLETVIDNTFRHFGEDAFTVNLWENKINCDCNLEWLPKWITQRNTVGVYPDVKMQCVTPSTNKGKVFFGMTPYDFTCDDGDETDSGGSDITPIPSSSSSSATSSEMKKEFDAACPDRCTCYYTKENYNGPAEFPIVDCNGAGYTYIPSGISPLTKSLVLESNQLKYLELSNLKDLKDLRYLGLKGNRIADISCTESISDCTFNLMSQLDLEKNELTYISADSLKYFPALHSLKINFNQITNIPANLLRGKRYLKKVLLGPNPIVHELDERLIDGLSLEILRMGGLNLKNVPNFIKNQRNLRKLDLSDNKITKLAPDAFSGLVNLEKLWIEHNQLTDLPDGFLRQMPSLIELALTENNLTTMRNSMFDGMSEKLASLQLFENPFRCDCNMAWFKDYVDKEKTNDPSTDMRFTCTEPARVHGRRADDMTTSDFVCLDDDVSWKACGQSDKVYTNTEMAIAIIVTIIIILVIVGLIMVYVFYCRKNPTPVPHFNNTMNFNSASNPNSAFVNLEEDNKM